MYEVVFYEDKDGNKEVEDYLTKLTQSSQLDNKKVSGKYVISLNYLDRK